jgi:hypothetical protein
MMLADSAGSSVEPALPTGSGDAPGFDLVTIAENNLLSPDGKWFGAVLNPIDIRLIGSVEPARSYQHSSQ